MNTNTNKARFDLPTVKRVRAADLSDAEIRAMERAGIRVPLSARIGRGPLATFKGARVS